MSYVTQQEFMSVCISRMRDFDEVKGTNNYLTDTSIMEATQQLLNKAKRIDSLIAISSDDNPEGRVIAKTDCADLANLAMILWSKL